jgi:hypothetical protein
MLEALTVNVTVASSPSARATFAGETVQVRLSGNSQNTVMLVAYWLRDVSRTWNVAEPPGGRVAFFWSMDALKSPTLRTASVSWLSLPIVPTI